MPALIDRYFAQPNFTRDTVALSENLLEEAETTLTIPEYAGKVLAIEAFYCGGLESEMPSRVVLYGSTIIARSEAEKPMHFQLTTGNGQDRSSTRHLPVTLRELSDTDGLIAIAESMRQGSGDDIDVLLDARASSMLKRHSQENGLPETVNFLALTHLVRYVGVNERSGRYLTFI
jgi:hypothetical protein